LVGGEELSATEREDLLQLCRQRVRETGISES
jgi:ribosomal protein S14